MEKQRVLSSEETSALDLETIKEHLEDRKWRINNLYWIKDDQGNHVKFVMNEIQEYLFDNLWYFNIVLKARQHGITTLMCILDLDDTIFGMKDSATIAHTINDAGKIFDSKIRYAWNNLPEWLKNEFDLDQNNARTLKFKRGGSEASVYIGTSLRGGTLQNLHITELATIDQREPDKALEIKTGALNTVHQGQMITIESTSKGSYGVFYDICKQAMDFQKEGKELSPMDWKFFFFPWYVKKEYSIDTPTILTKETKEYFKKLEGQVDYKFTPGQMAWYQKKKDLMKEQMLAEFPSTPEESFQANVEGSYYGKQMDWLRERGHILRVPYDPKLRVHTFWDIGVGDATSITFVQPTGFEIRVIDYYESSGEGMAHYAKVLKEKGYLYGSHNAPHDIEVQEFGSGNTRRATAEKMGISFNVIEKLGVEDGIEAVRNILPKCYFDETNCTRLVKALSEYRKEFDEKLGTFKNRPLHNWASNPADSFRMLGIGMGNISGAPIGMDKEEFENLKRQNEGTWDPHNLFPE
jgi:hypothetical protein